MTAEIAIVNRQGIALAADSAVTIGRNRVWKSANKLFSLGPANDIAIMIYNTGDFVGISWEVIVKVFREHVGNRRFETVRQCEEEFFKYLDTTVLPPSSDSDFTIYTFLIDMTDHCAQQLKYKSLAQLQSALDGFVAERTADLKDDNKLKNAIPYDLFWKKFRADTAVISKETFGFRLTKPYLERFGKLLYEWLCRKTPSGFRSGIVFAGFGSAQLLPYIGHYIVDGRMRYFVGKKEIKQTRFWLEDRCDLSGKNEPSACVFPFAQSDMFRLFMEGIMPHHLRYLRNVIAAVLQDKSEALVNAFVPANNKLVELKLQEAENDEIVKKFGSEFSDFRNETLVSPVLDVIEALPKEEMAAMAEALVELTALRRRVGSTLENVGGPTDVAVISKGEGLVWLKRKHYFLPELNDDFLSRKSLRSGGDQR